MPTTGVQLPLNPTSPNLAVDPARASVRRPVLPHPEPVRPGLRLRAAVDTVLSGPVTDPAAATSHLVTGLAWTAACGETCQVAPQVAAVRAAIAALAGGDVDTARAALTDAARALSDAPTLPVPRGSALDN